MKTKKIVIFGAGSLIAQKTARLFAKEGAEIYLISRDAKKLEEIKKDLEVLGANKVITKDHDASDISTHKGLVENIVNEFGDFNTVLVAYGHLANQQECEKNNDKLLAEININFTSVISILSLIANYFEIKNEGSLAVISSVAGDRGRKSNYVYGASKAGLTAFLQGLRNRFGKSKINVLTIKPGFVDTPMTSHLKKGLLFASAEYVAKDIYNAILKKKEVIYTPFYWRYILLIIKIIPENIFKRLCI